MPVVLSWCMIYSNSSVVHVAAWDMQKPFNPLLYLVPPIGLQSVPFWGQLGTNYLKFEWFVPKTGLRF